MMKYKSFLGVKGVLLFTLFAFLITSSAMGQVQRDDINDLWDDYYPYRSDSDSIWFEDSIDSIYMAGAETLRVFIPTGYTNGQLRFHGTVTSLDSLVGGQHSDYEGGAADTILHAGSGYVSFYLSLHTGDGEAPKTDEAETKYYMDSVAVNSATGATGTFDFNPMSNSTLQKLCCEFYTLWIINDAGVFLRFWIEVERGNAVKVR